MDLKKEIKVSDLVRRKKRAEAEAAPAAEEKPKAKPFWKKEIGGSRKPKSDAAPEHVPFWKKEISIGRRARPAAAAPEPALVALEARAAELELEVDELVLEQLARAVDPGDHVELDEVEHAEIEPAEAEAAAPVVDAGVEPQADDGAYGWLTEELAVAPEAKSWVDRVAEEPLAEPDLVEKAPAAQEDAAPERVAAPESVAAPDEPPSLPVAFSAPEPAAPVEVAPGRAGVPAPRPGIHPPVPADQLPPLAREEPPTPPAQKTSPLRKEISFRRKRNEKAESAPKPAGEKTPFWKKELGRKKHAPAAAASVPLVEPAVAAAVGAAEEKKPRWKRDPAGTRSSKQERAPKEKRERAARAPRAKRTRGKGGERHKKLVGLKIGASQIAAAHVVNNGSAQLVQVARAPLEPGIVVGGELRDPDALAEALKVFFRRHKLPKRGIRLGIANNRIGVRSFDLEGIGDPKQLENAIRFRAQEALPIPIEEAVLDYQVLGERLDDEGQPVRRVLLVVAYRELIDRYLDACRKAGIRLVGIDLEAFALLRALGTPRDDADAPPEAATVAVAVGYDRSTFAVSDGRVCEFTRVLEWGGFAINVALARALDIAPSEAEPVKRALSLDADDVPEGLTADQAALARDAMKKQVSSFARELVSSLQFYQSQAGSLSIAAITVTGGTAHLPGFADELQRLIGVPVHVGDPLMRVKPSKKLNAEEQVGSLAVAIGLGIED